MDGPEGAVTLRTLIENEIPDGRASLENSCSNLERVAAYCEANYAQKKWSFQRATDFTFDRIVMQSLASVAYQVNTLAYALLHALDLQTDKINNMTLQVHNVGEIIAIHKEKVARREIGILTINKCVKRQHKVIAVGVQEPLQRYQRTPIDYSILDNLGHGVRTPELVNQSFVTRGASTLSHGNSSAHYPVFPNFEQLLPKANITATLSRSSTTRGDHYRTPQVATTPVIDPQRFSTVTHGSQNYNDTPSASNYGTISRKRDSQQSMPLPPPQLASVAQYRLSTNSLDGLPPPPMSVMVDDEPLPPPRCELR
ncbi:Abl interactor 1 [Dirofilaria immitis]|nr:Abl interactor 1 [Dirofilaria immitis]